jgi:hypothetical protein
LPVSGLTSPVLSSATKPDHPAPHARARAAPLP